MSYEIYKLIHFFAIISLFLAIGTLLAFSGDKKRKKRIMILHGLAVLALLVSGFGLIARLNMHSFPSWIWLKLGIWITLGILTPILIGRKINKKWIWLLVFISGLGAIYLGVLQPVF